MRFAVLVLACMLTACATPESAAPVLTEPPYEVISREQQVNIDANTASIRIDNPHGDVRVRVVEGLKMGVYATIQRIGEAPLDPRIEIDRDGTQASLTVRYPSAGPGRVDLAVFVPERLAIDVQTSSGLAQVRRAKRDVRVRTTSGKIEVTGHAGFNLVTASGDIVVRQTTGAFDVAIAETASGSVYATVPAFADVILDVAANRIDVQQVLPPPTSQSGAMILSAKFGRALRTIRIRGHEAYLTPEIQLP